MIGRTCVFCEQFKLYPGDRGYSELTPGYGATICCDKGYWEVDLYKDNRTTYRNKLLIAETCKDYQLELGEQDGKNV